MNQAQHNYDIVIVGGGFAGVAAAIAAAREKKKVLLLEQSGFLGGAPGNCLVNPFMRYSTILQKDGDSETLVLSQGLFTEICDRLRAIGGFDGQINVDLAFREECLKLVLDRMCAEAGVCVLLHSTLCEVRKEENRITEITCITKAGKLRFTAEIFIDATGDADLAVMADCPTVLGRAKDHLCQPMTLCFRMANVDMALFRKNRKMINPLYQEWKRSGKIRNPREDVLIFIHPVANMLHFNTTRVVKCNPVDPFDLTKAEMEAREQMFELVAFLKENIPGFEHAELAYSAPQIGVRESRMIEGKFVLTEQMLKETEFFSDAIACGNYDIDIHNPEGSGTSHYYFPDGSWYGIPYRCLLPQNAENLLVAGRCISATHEAQASIRIMPIVCTLGEAAGIAAAVCVSKNVVCANADVAEIQRKLRANGAFIDQMKDYYGSTEYK